MALSETILDPPTNQSHELLPLRPYDLQFVAPLLCMSVSHFYSWLHNHRKEFVPRYRRMKSGRRIRVFFPDEIKRMQEIRFGF